MSSLLRKVRKDENKSFMAKVRAQVLHALRQHNGNREATAKALGYKEGSRMSLYRIMLKDPVIAAEFPVYKHGSRLHMK